MNELDLVTKEKLQSYLKITGLAKNLTPEEQTNFLQIAVDFNLNPFKREIYCTTYGKDQYRTTSIIIGYEVYIKRAERTQLLDGWKVTTSGSVQAGDLKAHITIWRKDRKFPFEHEVDYSEYVQTVYDKESNSKRPNKMWNEKPVTMLKKVVTAQGFRLCFSDELGGIPYDNSELPGAEEREIQVSSQVIALENPVEIPQPPPQQEPQKTPWEIADKKLVEKLADIDLSMNVKDIGYIVEIVQDTYLAKAAQGKNPDVAKAQVLDVIKIFREGNNL